MPNAAATNSATPPTTTRTLHPNRLTDTSCCDHRQNPPMAQRAGGLTLNFVVVMAEGGVEDTHEFSHAPSAVWRDG